MRIIRWIAVLAAAVCLLAGCASGEGQGLRVDAPAEAVRPGWPAVITFTVPAEGECDLRLLDEDGEEISVIWQKRTARAGTNAIYWNGTWNGYAAPEGEWRLVLEMNGETAEAPITVGPVAPALLSATADRNTAAPGDSVMLRFYATEEGSVTLYESGGGQLAELLSQEVKRGWGDIGYQVELPAGDYELKLLLTDNEGACSEPVLLLLTVVAEEESEDWEVDPGSGSGESVREESTREPVPTVTPRPRTKGDNIFTPAHSSPYEGQDTELNYWHLPMDITDEEAVWQVLMSPVTVVDNGKKNAEKTQVVIRSRPDEESEGLGVVTCVTQGVHVLERGETWSLIECYSSSFHDSPILNWNALVQGYVPTAYLKETVPNQEYGLVIDKLTQRLYVFMDGHLFSTLLVSTGLANERQPYNETRSGEFLLTSAVGTFSSDDLKCAMALRFNRGDLLHEVPYYLLEDGTRDYSVCEPKLGTKASHGCIRVQRKETPEGINQGWLWQNRKANTKLLIWEDWQGRQIPIPSGDTVLYRTSVDRYYHSQDHCPSLRRSVKFKPFLYSELEDPAYAKLRPCEYCAPPLRAMRIAEINVLYAPGGDHDPVMTEARKSCPRPLKRKK